MSKLKVSTREIGTVCVFDLEGSPTAESLQEVVAKIQRNIRRHRMQRVILNLQRLSELDALGLRKLMAVCIRPQKSLIFGASQGLVQCLEETYVPKNVRICPTEKEVAEDFGPFLLEKDRSQEFLVEEGREAIGLQVERRRSKRMHVALPVSLRLNLGNGQVLETRAIATNISEGGMFAEYLDLEVAQEIDALADVKGLEADIHIFPSDNFPEEYRLAGRINRKDIRRKQVGLAIEFLAKGQDILGSGA